MVKMIYSVILVSAVLCVGEGIEFISRGRIMDLVTCLGMGSLGVILWHLENGEDA